MNLYGQSMMVKVTHSPDMLVDDKCDTNLLIHDINKAEDLFFKVGTIPVPIPTENSESKNVLTIVNHLLQYLFQYKTSTYST